MQRSKLSQEHTLAYMHRSILCGSTFLIFSCVSLLAKCAAESQVNCNTLLASWLEVHEFSRTQSCDPKHAPSEKGHGKEEVERFSKNCTFCVRDCGRDEWQQCRSGRSGRSGRSDSELCRFAHLSWRLQSGCSSWRMFLNRSQRELGVWGLGEHRLPQSSFATGPKPPTKSPAQL